MGAVVARNEQVLWGMHADRAGEMDDRYKASIPLKMVHIPHAVDRGAVDGGM